MPGAGEDALAGYVRQARALLEAAGPVPEEAGPSWLPPELERLRDFHLPTTARSPPSADGRTGPDGAPAARVGGSAR